MKNKEFTLILKKLSNFTDQELVEEIKQRVDNNSIQLLAQLFKIIASLSFDNPELYVKMIEEAKKS